ncbi:hypothetical protein Ait01nite_081600 [Actinoplanes italicus]|uniref:WD40 repeat protein n=1 Tax=Actinoplanes italicus TaxID=113567 RepID=A0A2T0K397_9ACTN|nr:hypothetical protein [Actinoplanes italicus]PRX17326.1 WD40 repeat protein [Actinoplanes italicus]GIE35115.1 hypothetical protein Ait01nite_081600 [Actinoplanes italicus]
MARPERPLDDPDGPVALLAAELRQLREKAGKPGYRQMAARANYSVATLSAAASGRRLPTLEVTLAYVAACDGDLVQWEQRWREAERSAVAPGGDPAGADAGAPSPYPGLAPFQPEDAELFFGRDALVADLVRRLEQRRFLAVFGPSGAGKSSVVRAGLVPALGGPVLVMTPGMHPMTELAVHLARHTGLPAGAVLDELRAGPERAHLLVRQGLPAGQPQIDLLVVVDQFEETFAACPDPAERTGFIIALLAMCREPDGRARVVLAVRADHYPRFAEHPRLAQALTDAQVLIGGMTPAELREAAAKPAERYGARVEGALVATLVAEVAGSPGALPLAAHALREAWRRRQGAMVTLAGYQAAGGVSGAVAHTAEQAHERLAEPQRLVARRILLRMVDIGADGLVTRRRLGRTELDTIEQAPAVIEAFAAARLVTVDRDSVQITHEALIRAWPRLRGWVEESRSGLRLHRQLTEATAAWESLGRDEGALYRGLRLSATVETVDAGLVDPTGTEREFLEAGRALREREERAHRRRTRRLLAGLVGVLTVVCVLAAGAAVSARRAGAERDRAVARELAAGARAERVADPELGLLLASRAYRLHPDAETESVLRQATADARTTRTIDVADGIQSSVAVAGTWTAHASSAGVVTVRDVQGRTSPVTAPVRGDFLAAGPDGHLAIALTDPEPGGGPVVIWRPGDAGEVRRLPAPEVAPPSGVFLLAYSPDGRWVAATGPGIGLLVWDTGNDRPPRSLPYTGFPSGLGFGPDGRLVLGADDGTIRIWDVGADAPPVLIRQPREFSPSSVAVSPDGDRIAVGGLDRVLVWPDGGRGEPQTYRGSEYWYTSVEFSPDGRRIAAGTSERTVRIWNLSDSGSGQALRGHRDAVLDLAFTPDGGGLVSGGHDSTVRVWDVGAAADPAVITLPVSDHWAQLSADGSFTVTPTGPGTLAVFPTRTPPDATTLRNAPLRPESLDVSADGRSVAAATSGSEQIYWWHTTADERPAVLECPRDRAGLTNNRLALSADGRVLAVECGDGTSRVWRAGGSRVDGPADVFGGIAIRPDGGLVAMTRSPGALVLWDTATGRVTRTIPSQSTPSDHLEFSPDGRLLAVAGTDGSIRVWTVAGDDDPVVLTGATGQTTALTFSPDGRLIASAGTDDVVRLWNTDGSGEALTFDHPGARQIAFAADGRQLLGMYGTTVRITACEVCGPISEVLALAGQRTTRDLTREERAKYLREPSAVR